MTLNVPPTFAQASIMWSLGGDPENMAVTLGVLPAGSLQDAAADLDLRTRTAFGPAQTSSEWSYRGVVLRRGDGVVAEVPANIVGSQSGGNTVPNNCALLIRKQTNRGGRTGRGRMYLPPFGLAETGVDARGLLAGGGQAAWQGLVNAWLDGGDWYLFHDTTSPGGTDPTPIESFIVDNRIATQRRRMRP